MNGTEAFGREFNRNSMMEKCEPKTQHGGIGRRLLMIWAVGVLTGTCVMSSQIFVAITGSDTTTGTIDTPLKTITKAMSLAKVGDTIYVRGGTYALSSTINFTKSGTASAKYYLFAFQQERALLDFTAIAFGSRGMNLSKSYWHIKGLDVLKAGDNGMNISGSNNIVENCSFSENGDTGLQLSGGASNNQIINCDSYYNVDPSQGNADGFAPKLDVGTGNYFYGCRSWQNSDDGWDGYMRPSDNVTTTLENCWTFQNGYLKSGSESSGNGNGFKLGGGNNSNADSLRHNMILKKCLAFDNRVKGFDQNNNRGSMTLLNCTAFRNGTNYQISAGIKSGSVLTVKNCVALGSYGSLASFAVQQTNSWLAPFSVGNVDFVGIDTAGVRGPRKPDGSLPDVSFMHLAKGSKLIDAGTDVGLPYVGGAPDMGAFEYGPSTTVSDRAFFSPQGFDLLQNYPNPFNPSTTISYRLAVNGFVTLKVFNILGEEVAMLANEFQSAGAHHVSFSMLKYELPSGAYVYRLEAQGTVVSKTMMLIK